MGQKQTETEHNKSQDDILKNHHSDTENDSKDEHMIEVLKKENNVLKNQIISLNGKNTSSDSNNYDTLLSMIEVLNLQRKKIESIFQGKYFIKFLYIVRKQKND